jgi:hypothetical protein
LFNAGDRTVLFDVIATCARFQAIIPKWATDEILLAEHALENGNMKDFNAVFGYAGEHLASRKKKARLAKYATQVLSKLQQLRLEGGSLNADDIFADVANELGISRRDVEDIYKNDGKFIKELPRENTDDTVYGFAKVEIPYYRRYGRPILKDKQ